MHLKSISLSILSLALAVPMVAQDIGPSATAPLGAERSMTFEFRGARLGQVLDHFSKEAGFIIANPVELPAPITLIAKQAVTPNEAVEALNSVLITQNYAAFTRGRTLYVVPLPNARQANLPVMVGVDPEKIPESDTMVTQVMPVQFAGVKELTDSITPLLNPSTSTLSVNESSNTIVMTGTQTQVRRVALIIRAIDGSISGEQQVRVFLLQHASADRVATLINTIYGNRNAGNNRNQNQQDPFTRFINTGGNAGGRNAGSNAASGGAEGKLAGRSVEVTAAADVGTNNLVVRASPSAMAVVEDIVKKLDVNTTARDGVLLYRVKNSKAVDLAKSLNDLFQNAAAAQNNNRTQNQNQNRTNPNLPLIPSTPSTPTSLLGGGDDALDLAGQVRVIADAVSNSVMVLTSERNFPRLMKLLADLDQPMRQVLVRVLVAEVSIEDGLDLGVQLEELTKTIGAGDTRVSGNYSFFDANLGLNGFKLSNTDFRAAIRALASNTNFDVLSRPYILTTDNRQAIVNVSQEVPVINGSRTDANNNVTSTFDRRDVGVILKVTPQINSEGSVVLDVNQELSALSDQGIPVAKDIQSPIIRKRTMTTRVMVRNGQTVVIGGLVSDSKTERRQKVPLLGDIPVLGMLFRRQQKTVSKTELMVFLTPQVISDPDSLDNVGEQLRAETSLLNSAVDTGFLKRHLDQMANLRVGQGISASKSAPVPAAGVDKPRADK